MTKIAIAIIIIGMILSPSILSADWSKMASELKLCEDVGVDQLHCDIMDGNFVPNISFGPKFIQDIRSCTSLFLEVHLMVRNPSQYISRIADAGADACIFHIEEEQFLFRAIQSVRRCNMKVGLAINPQTPVSMIVDVCGLFDIITVMGVDPGFGGQTLIPLAVDKIATLDELRKAHQYNFTISIDGGVNIDNIPSLVYSGVDTLIMGSAFFQSDDKHLMVKKIREHY